MRFNRRARLDTSRIRDRRGRGGGIAVGGGLGGIVIVVLILLAGGDPSALLGGGGGSQGAPRRGGLQQCATAADIQTQPECRFVAVENSLRDYWSQAFARSEVRYADATFTTFSGAVNTGCGSATSQVGPFYCPADRGVYLDIGFFETLQTRLGAQGGDFAEAYVVAHEYGHHVQNLTGRMDRINRSETGESSDAVRLELQADCYAGVWAFHATTTQTTTGEPLITEITRADIAEAVDAAETVGDDYIQERMSGTVSPETWTHGSSEQRRRWFEKGLSSGDPNGCDTFAAGEVSG